MNLHRERQHDPACLTGKTHDYSEGTCAPLAKTHYILGMNAF
jgi:hypothetical protein